MKKAAVIISAFVSVFLCFSVISVCADSEISIEIPEDFTVNYAENGFSSVAKKTGMDEKALESYAEQNGIMFIAVNSDNSSQFRLSKSQNAFSKKVKDISALDENAIGEFAKSLSDQSPQMRTVSGIKYITFTETLSDSGGEYTAYQMITVKNEYIYQFSCYNSGGTVDNQTEKIVLSLKINDAVPYSPWQKVKIGAIIVLLAGVIAIMVIGIVRDIKA